MGNPLGCSRQTRNSKVSFSPHRSQFVWKRICPDFRYLDGIKFIDDTVSNWQPMAGLVQHIWWHKSLLNIETENYEGALSIFDDHLIRGAKKGMAFSHLKK